MQVSVQTGAVTYVNILYQAGKVWYLSANTTSRAFFAVADVIFFMALPVSLSISPFLIMSTLAHLYSKRTALYESSTSIQKHFNLIKP